MKIEDINSLAVGAEVEIEGNIYRALKPRQTNYGWGQFIVVEDVTGRQGCNVGVRSKDEGFKTKQCVLVKGKLSDWYKDSRGVDKRTIEGGVFEEIKKDEKVSQEQPLITPPQETTQKSEKVDPKVWEDKDLRMARESALKNIAQYVVAGLVKLGDRFDYAHEDVDFIYNGLEKVKIIKPKITIQDSLKEFGGTAVVENKDLPEGYKENVEKEQKIDRAKELVKNPHLADPVNKTMATVKQKKLVYGYIDEEDKKIGGIVDSRYIKKGEKDSIGKAQDLTKANAIRYYEYWYGKEGEMGERDKRELTAKEKEGSPFVTEREPVEKIDPKDDTSLTKDVLINDIQELRKKLFLEDDTKFKKELGYNTNFEKWTEKELIKVKNLLKDWKPSWITER